MERLRNHLGPLSCPPP